MEIVDEWHEAWGQKCLSQQNQNSLDHIDPGPQYGAGAQYARRKPGGDAKN